MRRYYPSTTMTARASSCMARPVGLAVHAERPPTAAPFVGSTTSQASLTPQTARAQHQAAAALSRAPHPDAVFRDAQRELRKLERMQVIEVEKTATWWESEHGSNVSVAQTPSQLSKHLALATHPNARPLVMSFFVPSCPGCKRMYPKLMQLARDHPHFDFVKVNTADLQEECELLGVDRLPFFKIWSGGKCTHSFSCNLSTIATLRRSLDEGTRPPRPYTVFTSPSIAEMPRSNPPSGALSTAHASSSTSAATAAAVAAASASASVQPGSFGQRAASLGGPAGAVRGSGKRMPSIDDLVSHQAESSEPPAAPPHPATPPDASNPPATSESTDASPTDNPQ